MARDRFEGRNTGAMVMAFCALAVALAGAASTAGAVEARPLVLAQADQAQGDFQSQLQAAVAARRAKDFERAREILAGLERRAARGTPRYWEVSDEINFHLPLAVSQQAMNEGEIGLAESKIDEAARYLTNHPRRGELSQTLERYRRALWMVK
ncbi:hypothetical protein H0Z60_12000 [Ectothiorhodospiraceae bacterium WFHF3C12]|nr:hypothetical protein [Ectothiorhodospiraceae bacterium WFHF3C12]